MATTAIVAEILIAGLEAAVWLMLFVLTIFGVDWVDLGAVKDWQALVTLLVVAAAYALGILVDRAADTILRRVEHLFPGRPVDKPAGVARMRLTLLAGNESVAKFHDYQRSRMRIARATVLNLALLAPALALFLPIRGDVNWWRACIAVTTTLIAIGVAKLYRRIEFAYVERLADAYRLEGKSKKRKPDLAAAICWRRKNDILQFRLVRTTSEDKWSSPRAIPKGAKTSPRQPTARRKKKQA